MKAFTGLLLLAAAVAFLSTSCGKTLNCKCVGQLYAEDGSSEPATLYVEFEVWPWWVLWSKMQGSYDIESHEPHGIVSSGYFREGATSNQFELTTLAHPEEKAEDVGLFFVRSGSLGLKLPHGNFVGNCEHYKPIRLAR
jgi:hypothetical protein